MPGLAKGAQNFAEFINSHKQEIKDAITNITDAVKTIFIFISDHGEAIKVTVLSIVGAIVAWNVATAAATVVQEIHNASMVISALSTGGLTAGTTALTAAKGGSTLATMAQMGATVGSTVAYVAHGIAIGAVAVAHGVAAAAVGVATAAQWLFNAALNANPIGLIIIGIAALIAIVILVATHWKEVCAVLLSVWETITGAFDTSIKAIGGFFSGLWDGIKSGFVTVVNFLIDGLNTLIKFWLLPFNLLIKGLNLLPGVNIPELKFTIPDIPKFDVGTNYVPFDMIAMIHKGEQIVPKSQNPYANSGNVSAQNKSITQNFYGDIHAESKGDQNRTLQQLQFAAVI
jgi:hypothetical protein